VPSCSTEVVGGSVLGIGSEVSMRRIDHESGGWSLIALTFLIVTCCILGLLAGGMLVIGVSLVNFGRASHPASSKHGLQRIPTCSVA
jgi:hypothetical protein